MAKKVITVGGQMWSWVEQDIYTDCIMNIRFQGQKLKTYKLHKMILMKSSPVFKRMFETDMTEGKTGEIKIIDIEPRIMELALKHMYGCRFTGLLIRKDIQNLLSVADKYEIITLFQDCADYIVKNMINPDHVLFLMNLPTYRTLINSTKKGLHNALLKVLLERTSECIAGQDKLEIDEAVIHAILNLENCKLRSELDLIKFVDCWAVNKINKEDLGLEDELIIREMIGSRISFIRFLTLSREEFTEFCTNYNWLTRTEKKEILKCLTTKKISNTFPPNLSKSVIHRCQNLHNCHYSSYTFGL